MWPVPAPGLIFAFGPGEVELDRSGAIAAVQPLPGRPSYLTGGGLVTGVLDGAPLVWAAPSVERGQRRGGIRLPAPEPAARRTAQLRDRLADPAGADQHGDGATASDHLRLGWRPAPEHAAWALAAGAVGAYAVLPPSGLRAGAGWQVAPGIAPAAVDEAGVDAGPVVLDPGGRYVVQWSWEWYGSPQAFQRGRHGQVPRHLVLLLGEAATIESDDDQAVVLPPLVEAEHVGDQLELLALSAGAHPVEVRSARGVTRYDLTVAQPYSDVIDAAARLALDARPGPGGIVRLPDLDAALAVQQQFWRPAVPRTRSAAEDALEVYVAELVELGDLDPRAIAFACGEYERTGEEELIDAATRAVLAATTPAPGLGMAAARLCLARVAAGREVAPVLEHLRRLRAAPLDRVTLGGRAARLELGLLFGSARTCGRVGDPQSPAAGRPQRRPGPHRSLVGRGVAGLGRPPAARQAASPPRRRARA